MSANKQNQTTTTTPDTPTTPDTTRRTISIDEVRDLELQAQELFSDNIDIRLRTLSFGECVEPSINWSSLGGVSVSAAAAFATELCSAIQWCENLDCIGAEVTWEDYE